MFAGILVIGLIGLITDQFLQFFARVLFPYQARQGGFAMGRILRSAIRGTSVVARTAGDLVWGGLAARAGVAHRRAPVAVSPAMAREEVRDVPVS